MSWSTHLFTVRLAQGQANSGEGRGLLSRCLFRVPGSPHLGVGGVGSVKVLLGGISMDSSV